MRALIELDFESSTEAEQVLQAISPDNFPLPPGLDIASDIDKAKLVIEISCSRGLKSLGATVEDLMSAIDLSLRTMKSLEQ
ncbi:MAG: KEOPS complex subunit Pcc1 [Candidatus Thorarchaeota archaeon]